LQNQRLILFSRFYFSQANLSFLSKLVRALSPAPFLGAKVSLLTSKSASTSFINNIKKDVKGGAVSIYSLKDGTPEIKEKSVCILIMPSSRNDYLAAQELATSGNISAVVVVNGFAKDQKSIPGSATMAYFLKPLTYNSQVAGYLVRSYPSDWAVINSNSNKILDEFSDEDILVKGTNTPDLRNSVRIVQRAADEQAIQDRNY